MNISTLGAIVTVVAGLLTILCRKKTIICKPQASPTNLTKGEDKSEDKGEDKGEETEPNEPPAIQWVKKPNVAQYGCVNWNNEVKLVSSLTVEQAKKIAEEEPQITFFFYVRQPMYLTKKGNFQPGDAVFLSGEPSYGTAPQADAYEKVS